MSTTQPSAPPAAPAAPAHGGGWANPSPAGLVALALATFVFWAMLTGQVSPKAAPYVGIWLLGGFIIQFVVALIELREGAMSGGNIFLYFSAYFMFASGMKFLLGTSVYATFGIDARIDGWAWACLLIATWGFTPAYLKRGPATLTIALLLLDAALPFIMLVDLKVISASTFNPVAGWLLLASGLFALYTCIAMINNNAFGKQVLPFPGPFMKQ